MSEATKERPIQYGGDLLNFASGLRALFEKNLINRGEVRTALREWGLSLDEDMTPSEKNELQVLRMQKELADRLFQASPSDWDRIKAEYSDRSPVTGVLRDTSR